VSLAGGWDKRFLCSPEVQTGSGDHAHPMDGGSSIPIGKSDSLWRWPLVPF